MISSSVRKAVFLDRDGVINQAIIKNGKPYPPSSISELKIITGVKEALEDLREAGFLLIEIGRASCRERVSRCV